VAYLEKPQYELELGFGAAAVARSVGVLGLKSIIDSSFAGSGNKAEYIYELPSGLAVPEGSKIAAVTCKFGLERGTTNRLKHVIKLEQKKLFEGLGKYIAVIRSDMTVDDYIPGTTGIIHVSPLLGEREENHTIWIPPVLQRPARTGS
jgi:hypothetical protein